MARMSVLDGMQPTFTHVPPIVPSPTIATRLPLSAAVMAAENAPDPAPIIRISGFVSALPVCAGGAATTEQQSGIPYPPLVFSLVARRCRHTAEMVRQTKLVGNGLAHNLVAGPRRKTDCPEHDK
jgi:hypothetical protein